MAEQNIARGALHKCPDGRLHTLSHKEITFPMPRNNAGLDVRRSVMDAYHVGNLSTAVAEEGLPSPFALLVMSPEAEEKLLT